MAQLDIAVPEELEGTKSVVRSWLKQVGETVEADEPIVELETDKVAMEVFAPAAGTLSEVLMDAGAEAQPGSVLGRLVPHAAAVASATTMPAEKATVASAPRAARAPSGGSITQFDRSLRLSPSVRQLLMARHADPASMAGSGRDGRLTREDVLRHLAVTEAPAAAPSRTSPVALANQRVPHDAMRLRIAEHMSRSLASAPHVTAVFEADFSRIIAHRESTKAEFAAQGVNLTYTAYFIAACVEAMAAAPSVNSRWHDDALEIFEDVNVGVGTALGDNGLIVPVVHRAQDLSLLGIAQRLQDMTDRARRGRLAPADVQGGTFSISNHGVTGSLVAAPIIINQPQSAILGIGKLEKRVVVRQIDGADAIAIRPLAYVSLSIDHRVVDGHQTNAWLTRFVEVLETWPAPTGG